MATKAKTLQVKDKEKDDKAADAPEKEAADAPSPLLDLSDAAVKKMIKQAKKRGFVTFDQLNEVLPSDSTSPEQIEDIMSMLSDMGINVTEADDEGEEEDKDADDDTDNELVEVTQKAVTEVKKSEPGERTDDPVRMYLREMGTVELLSREGEIAIAKRIEAGREAMIAGLCESPLTFQAIIIWRDELNEGKIFLRDIIDLEATYAGPDAKQNQAVATPQPYVPPKEEVRKQAEAKRAELRRKEEARKAARKARGPSALLKEFWNLPNILTLGRIAVIPLFVWCLGIATPLYSTIAAAIFTVAAVTDVIDGFLARRWNMITVVGKLLDPMADKLIVAAALIMMVWLGRVSAWLVIVLISREFIVTGVTDDIPANSSIAFDLVGSFHFLETGDYGRQNGDNWRRSSLLTFVKLRPGSGLPP